MDNSMLDSVREVLLWLLFITSLTSSYYQWKKHGPLTGTWTQRIKCLSGYHDWRLFAFSHDPLRLIWRCHRCAAEQLTPNTHAGRKEVDRVMSEQPATGKTVRL